MGWLKGRSPLIVGHAEWTSSCGVGRDLFTENDEYKSHIQEMGIPIQELFESKSPVTNPSRPPHLPDVQASRIISSYLLRHNLIILKCQPPV